MAKTSKQQTFLGFDEPEPARKPSVQERPAAEPSLARRASEVLPAEFGDLAGKSVYIVDSHSLIYQVFHAMPEMTGPSGQPVGAVQGLSLIHISEPTRLLSISYAVFCLKKK